MKNEKGELTTQQIVMIIILIVSFIIILFFIFRLDLGHETDKEICRNSVAMKDQSKLISGPLDCKTNYVCISGGGKCEGITTTITKDIDLNKPDAKEQIEKAIADEMADCWWMFGEGKADYVGFSIKDSTFGGVACSLCSMISFDKKIQGDEKLNFDYKKFYDYLQSTEKETGKSYLYYLYGSQKVEDVEKIISVDSQEPIDFTKQYAVLTGIGKTGALKTSANWFAKNFFDAASGFYLITPKFPDIGKIPVTLKEKSKINDLKCDDFLTKA